MKDNDEISEIYSEKKDIEKFVNILKKFSYDELIKDKHYFFSLTEKNTSEDFMREIYPQFERIGLVLHRTRKKGADNYDFLYEMDDGTYVTYAITVSNDPPVLKNGFPVDRNFNNFKKHLLKFFKRY